jgi:glycosyltransferase involved in cell wall biosynthesis
VALPYYGDVELMKQAVRSVLGQRYQNWRLIVVDDNYPDPEPARWFATLDDSRIHYHRNERNLGANANYRTCLELVTARHVVVMGADDIMLPNYLQAIDDAFRAHPGASMVQVGVDVIDERGRRVLPLGDRVKAHYRPAVTERTALSGESLAVSLTRANWTYFPSLAWRTADLNAVGFREGLHVTQDLAAILDIVRAGGVLVLDPTIAFQYRRHSGSDSSVKAVDGRRFDEERILFREEAVAFAALGWRRATRAARWHVSSRLNALSQTPAVLRSGSARRLLPNIVRHVLT